MNWDQIEGNWEQLKGKAKQTWGKLTDDDLMVIKGREKQLAGKLQERYGYAKERTDDEIKRFMNECETRIAKSSSATDKTLKNHKGER
jgi:uncharacterized protein YjbJ (UPF0337 family)